MQKRDRPKESLRKERHRNANEQRKKAEQAQEKRCALGLSSGHGAGARNSLLNTARGAIVVAFDALFGASKLRQQLLDGLLLFIGCC